MSSLYSHNHYNEQSRFANLCARLPSLQLPTAHTKAILAVYFTILFTITTYCVFFIDYVQNFNLKYFQIYFVLFFALIFFVVILSWARQHYGDGHSIVIPMWLLGVANLIICFSGFIALFGGFPSQTEGEGMKPLIFAWSVALFDQLTLIVIAIYTIYRAFFTTTPQQTYNQSSHRQYALAATAEMDDSDVELELDLYTASDHHHYPPHSSSVYSNDSLNGLGATSSGNYAQTTTTTTHSQRTGMSPIAQPNFDMNLNDEYTDVE